MPTHRMTEESRKAILKASKAVLPYLNPSDALYFRTRLLYRYRLSDLVIENMCEKLTLYSAQLSKCGISYYDLRPKYKGRPEAQTESSYRMPSGKYTRRSIKEIAAIDLGYIQWIVRTFGACRTKRAAWFALEELDIFFNESPHIGDNLGELPEDKGQEELGPASVDYWL